MSQRIQLLALYINGLHAPMLASAKAPHHYSVQLPEQLPKDRLRVDAVIHSTFVAEESLRVEIGPVLTSGFSERGAVGQVLLSMASDDNIRHKPHPLAAHTAERKDSGTQAVCLYHKTGSSSVRMSLLNLSEES